MSKTVRQSAPILRALVALTIVGIAWLAPEARAQYTWNGGGGASNNWSNTANWAGGSNPPGDSSGAYVIHFAGGLGLTPNNDYAAYTQFQQILFDSGASSFTLGGNAVKLYNWGGTAKVENNSSNLQTVNMVVDFAGSGELDPTAGDLTIGSAVIMDSNGTLNVYGTHILTLNGAVQNGSGSAGNFALNGPATVVFNAANTYTGFTAINAGILQVGVAPTGAGTGSTYYVGNGGATGTAASLFLGTVGSSGGITFSNAIAENAGSSGNRTIGGLNTSGNNTYAGTLTLTDSNATLQAATGGTVTFNTITASGAQTVAIGGGGNNGTVSFNGTVDNTNVAATVNSGTLVLNKTSSSSVHALGSGLTVNSGATVQLSGTGGDQIFDTMAATVNSGGAFDTNDRSETLGVLTLSGTGISGAGALLNSGTSASTLTPTSTTLAANTTLGVTNSSASLALANVVSGSGFSLTKVGAGTLTLSGANTFSGGLIINAGTVSGITSNSALGGSGTGAVTLGAAGGSANATLQIYNATFNNPLTVASGSTGNTLTLANSTAGSAVYGGAITLTHALSLNGGTGNGTLNITGLITGSSNLTTDSNGTGYVQFSAAAQGTSFTGNVLVNSGTLRMNAATTLGSSNAISLNSGAVFELNANSETIAGLNDGNSVSTTVNNSGAAKTLTLGGSGTYSYGGVITATTPANMSVTKSGTGTQTLSGANTFAGTTTLSQGTLALTNASAIQSSTLTLTGTTALSSALQLRKDSSGTFADAATNFNPTSGGFTVDVDALTGAGVSGSTITLGSGGIAWGAGGAGNVVTITNNGGAHNYNLALGAITVNNVTPNLTNNMVNGTTTIASLNLTGGSKTFTFGGISASAITSIGAMSQTGVTLSVTQSGSGTLIITGASNYTGLTTVSSGTLKIGTTNAINSGNALTTSGTGILDINGNAQTLGLLTNGVTVTNSGASNTLTIGNGSTGAGAFTGAMNVIWNQGASNNALTGSFTNTGNLTLNANGAGTIGVTSANNTGTVTNSGTSTGATTITTVGANVTGVSQAASGGSNLTVTTLNENAAGETLSSTGSNLFTITNFTAAAGTANLVLAANSTGGITFTNGINNIGSITNSGSGSGTTTVGGTIGTAVNGGVFENSANSILALNGGNTFTSGLNIQRGTVQVGNAAGVGAGTVTIGSGGNSGTLDLNGQTETIIGLATAGTAASQTIGNSSTTANAVLNYTGATTSTFGGVIKDVLGAGTKTTSVTVNNGSANLTLSGANTYTGGTTISSGTLKLNNASALGSGGIVSLNGGTLDNISGTAFSSTASGAIGGDISIGSGGETSANNITFTGTTAFNSTFGRTVNLLGTGMTLSIAATFQVSTDASNALVVNGTGNTLVLGGLLLDNLGTTTRTQSVNGTGNLTVTGAVANGASTAAQNFSLIGPGTVTLNGNNTYTGLTTVNAAGTLVLAGDNTAATGGVTLTAGTLDVNSATALGGTAGTFTIGGGTIDNTSGSAKTLTQNNPVALNGDFSFSTSAGTASNNLIFGNGAVSVGGNRTITLNGAGALAFGGVLTNTGAIRTITVNNGAGTTSNTALSFGGYRLTSSGSASARTNVFNGSANVNITGAVIDGDFAGSGLTYSGTGTLALQGGGSYTGTTSVSNGTLSLTSALNGTTSVTTSNAGVVMESAAGSIGGSATFTQGGTGTSILLGTNTYTGTTTTNASGTIQLGNNTTTGSLSASSAITNNGTLIFNRSNTVTQGTDFNSVIGGSGAVTQAGSGTLILSGTNAYTGTTTINNGTTLQLGAGSTTGSLATGSTITDNGTLVFNRSNAVLQGTDFKNVIGGTGAVTQAGSSTLTLNGVNTYQGATSVTSGTMVVSGSGSINNSSGISINGATATFVQTSSVATTPAIAVTQSTLDGTGTVGAVSVANSSGAIVQNGNGAATAFTFGSLSFSGAATLNLVDSSSTPTARLIVSGALSTTPANGQVTINGSGSWSTGANNLISYGSFGGTITDFTLGTISGLTSHQSVAGLSLSGNNVVLTINGVTDTWTGADNANWVSGTTGGVGNWTISGSPADFLNGDSVVFDDTASGPTTVNISAATVTPGSITFNNTTKNYTIMSSGAFGIGGSGSLTKNGTGTLTLSTANTYSGGTLINAGTLQVGSATALGANTGAVTVASGAVLDLNGIVMTGTNALTLNGTGISSGGALTNSSATSATYAGLVTLGSSSSIIAGSGNITLSNAGTITGTGSSSLTVGGTKNTTFTSTIGSGVTTLTKQDAGTLTFNGSLNLTGGITESGGQLTISGTNNNIGGDITTSGSATLTMQQASGTNTFGNIIYNSTGSLNVNQVGLNGGDSAHTITFSAAPNVGGHGNMSIAKSITFNSSSATLNWYNNSGASTPATTTFSGALIGNAANTADSLTVNQGVNSALGGALSSVTFSGTSDNTNFSYSTVTNTTGGNVFSYLAKTSGSSVHAIGGSLNNALQINTGSTVQITGTGGDQIADTAGVTMNSTGTFDLNANSETINVLTGNNAGAIVTNSNNSATSTLTVGGNNGSATFAGSLQNGAGTLAFSKVGTGTETLTGANTYTGLTTVSAGELDLNSSAANGAIAGDNNSATNDITVNGGTLKWLGNEQVGDNATITMSSGTVDLNGKTETLGTLINGVGSTGTFSTGVGGTLIGTTATIDLLGGTNVVNAQGLVTDNHIVINGGTNVVQGAAGGQVNGTGPTYAGGSAGGVLRLTNSGTGIQMTGGTLLLNADNTSAGTLQFMNSPGTLEAFASAATSYINTNGSGSNAGTVDLGANTRTFTVDSGAAAIGLSISATITNGGLDKEGAGVLELTGAGNTYTGNTTVGAGTLLANNTSGSATGTGGVMVNNTGTLGGTGIINAGANTVTIATGGTITGATNGTIGALTLTAATLSLSGTYLVDINASSSDVLHLTGILSLSSATITFNQLATPTASLYVLATYTSESGTFTMPTLPTGYSLVYGATELDLVTAVPESGTWVAGALALATLLFFSRRRFRPSR